MKVGDYVGWADHDVDDKEPIRLAGIILESRNNTSHQRENYTEFLILLQYNGELSWEYGSDLVVIHEGG